MLTLAVRLLVWGHRLGGDSDPVYRLGGAVLSAALGLGHIDPALVAEALGRLVRAQERGQFSSPKDQQDLADIIAKVQRLGPDENP